MSRLLKWRTQFSIANLIFLTVIVALCLAWWQEKRERIATRSDLRVAWNENGTLRTRVELQESHIAELKVQVAVGPDYRDRHQLMRTGRFEEALPILERILQARSRFHGLDRYMTMKCQFDVGMVKCLTGQPGAAEPHLVAFLEYAANRTFITSRRAIASDYLAGVRRHQCRLEEAATLIHQSLAIKRKETPDSWTIFNLTSRLGDIVLRQGDHERAEPLMLSGYKGVLAREAKIGPQFRSVITRAAKRLVTLYEEWDKPEEADKWSNELERIKAKYGST